MGQAVPERRSGLRVWAAYAVAALALMIAFAMVATLVVPAQSVRAVWFSAALAYALQLAAFAGLVWFRGESQLLLGGWLIGMALRFGALGGVAWWLSRSAAFPREATLLSLVLFVVVLLMMEPIFLRWDLRRA